MLCGNVLDLSNFTVSTLSPAVLYHLICMSSVCMFCSPKISLATHAFLPFRIIILNVVFPERKYKKYLIQLYEVYGNEQIKFCSGLLTLCVIAVV